MIRNTLLSLFFTSSLFAQEAEAFRIDRFADISTTEESFTVSNVAARMIEGLGFRYYWATIDLEEADLAYKPSDSGRTMLETITHIHGLSEFMTSFLEVMPVRMNATGNYEVMRKATLINLEKVERKLKSMSSSEFETYKRGEITFWNFISGPVEDAVWHTGQIVMMRRVSGNPLPKGVNFLMGKKE